MRELGKLGRRDLFVPVARMQLLYVMNIIQESDKNAEELNEVKKFARGVAFNIASFTWPGWDDTPNITPEMERVGLSAAEIGLQLAEDINDVTPNILWINGVHALNAGQFSKAISHFERAKKIAGDETSVAMHKAWIQMTNFVENPSSESETKYTEALQALGSHNDENAAFFVDQLKTALEVMQRN